MQNEIFRDVILLLDKKKGITSYKAIEEIKKLAGIKKIGHSGTLDKSASGLLVICTGRLTKLARYFLESSKRYRGVIKLGVSTETCDSEGKVISIGTCPPLDKRLFEQLRNLFTGELMQVPPAYSALKISGKRASDLMRKGEAVDLPPRRTVIEELQVIEHDAEEKTLTIDVLCSKGTYIRSLARDIGAYLGCGAYLAELRRLESGIFNVDEAVTIDELKEFIHGGINSKKFLRCPEEGLSHFNRIIVNDAVVAKILNGALFSKGDILMMDSRWDAPYLIFNGAQNLIAIAHVDIDNWSVKYLNVFSG